MVLSASQRDTPHKRERVRDIKSHKTYLEGAGKNRKNGSQELGAGPF